MSRKHVLIAVSLVLLLAVPLTMAATDVTGVVGTTTDIDVGEADPNLAGLAGHAQYEVSWFSGAAIYSRSIPVADGKEICAVPDLQSTPVGQTLTSEGVTYATSGLPSTWTTTKYSYASGALFTYCVPVGVVADGGAPIGDYNFVMIVDTDDLATTALDLYVV